MVKRLQWRDGDELNLRNLKHLLRAEPLLPYWRKLLVARRGPSDHFGDFRLEAILEHICTKHASDDGVVGCHRPDDIAVSLLGSTSYGCERRSLRSQLARDAGLDGGTTGRSWFGFSSFRGRLV